MAVTGIVANATRVENDLSVAVQLPDGSFQRYTVSLLVPDIKVALEAAARQAVTPNNDARIKANLARITKGLSLDLADPAVIEPPAPTTDDVAVTAFALALKAVRLERAKAAMTPAIAADYNKAAPTLRARFDDALVVSGL